MRAAAAIAGEARDRHRMWLGSECLCQRISDTRRMKRVRTVQESRDKTKSVPSVCIRHSGADMFRPNGTRSPLENAPIWANYPCHCRRHHQNDSYRGFLAKERVRGVRPVGAALSLRPKLDNCWPKPGRKRKGFRFVLRQGMLC